MEFVRLIHPQHFDHARGKFTDLAFKKSRGSGMSIFERDCAEAASNGLICLHIEKFYKNVGGDPAVFCVFDAAAIPAAATVTQIDSDSGDACHHEVDGISDKALKRAFEDRRWPAAISICGADGMRALTPEDIAQFPNAPTAT